MAKTRKPFWRVLISLFIITTALVMLLINPNFVANKKKAKNNTALQQISLQIASLQPILKKNKYSNNLILLANLSLNIHTKRMYVVNPQSMQILHTCIISHGSGMQSTELKAVFSNKNGSNCSSLGLYKIAERYIGVFGPSYRLDGLSATNSNARSRFIVFHSYKYQSNNELIGPHFFSQGCPMLATTDWELIDKLIQKQQKPVLLYLYK